MEALDHASYVPLYIQIQVRLRDQVISNLRDGDRVPGDLELARTFGVSHMTVRQAITALVQEGLLERRKGSGTFVKSRRKLMVDLNSPLVQSEQWESQTALRRRVVIFDEVPCGEADAACLHLPTGTPVLRFVRNRHDGNRLIAVDDRYVPVHFGRQFERTWLEQDSLLRLFPTQLGISVARRVRDYEAAAASPEVAEWLELKPGAPVLRQTVRGYAADGEPLFVGRSYFRADEVRIRDEIR